MTTEKDKYQARKGAAVFIHGGTYEGESGWLDTKRGGTPHKHWVIIAQSDKIEKEFCRPLMHTSYVKKNEMKEPTTFVEAAVLRNRDIEKAYKTLCKKLVGVYGINS